MTSLLKELLEPKKREESGAQGEVGGQGEDEQQNREVDVEGVGDDGHHVHVAHHPGVRCLLLPVVDHMRVLRTTNQSSWPHYKDHMPPHLRGDQQSHHVGHLHPHHVDEREEVQAQGRCEPAQESTREEQGVPEGQLSLRTILVFKGTYSSL